MRYSSSFLDEKIYYRIRKDLIEDVNFNSVIFSYIIAKYTQYEMNQHVLGMYMSTIFSSEFSREI